MRTRITAAAALPGLLLAFCCAATAAEPAQGTTEVMFSGIKIGVDAKTGKLRPLTSAESAALDAVVRKPPASINAMGRKGALRPANATQARKTQRRIAGGGVAVKLPESHMSQVVASRDASGAVTIQHLDADAAQGTDTNVEPTL